ncbi:hypothetical protein BCR36DRAFT_185893 [Piromyces finnis]|uniref:RGS domain-containing protein n=1 Tax=Piromyces finnis TaxID=1754191 RepID=A0A1Y1VG86_9FUNG|nr:hypothetical protein BCR36DRAFT_185893 [Piromyces finnis]|eukprot:ORX55418.1 hypothetical protein BCR36DRAFT_185893 [Piromyces finnis]
MYVLYMYRIEYIPQLFLIFFFFLIFLPFSVIELYKLNDSINMKNSLMFTTIFMFISLFGYFLISLIPSYNCSKFVKYWPSDAFVLLLCISYHYTQITKPLISIIHLKRQAKKLVVSKQGLIKTLQDRILFTEFAEECKKGRCVENILFCVEYKKFKALINNKSHKSSIILNDIDEVPKSPSETEYSKFTCTSSIQDVVEKKKDSIDECRINIDDSKTNNKRRFSENFINKQRSRSEERIPSITSIVDKKKMLSSHLKWSSVNLKHGPSVDDIINRINYIYEKFIKSFSDYELNLTSKVVKKITNTINDLNTMVKDHETISFASLSEMNFDIIFDEAYDEVLDSLYLNVYMQYVVKKQSKPDKKTTANSS